jgi:hypothetical protein
MESRLKLLRLLLIKLNQIGFSFYLKGIYSHLFTGILLIGEFGEEENLLEYFDHKNSEIN